MGVRPAALTRTELLKFQLLQSGLALSAAARAYVDERNGGRAMTPADYASTSGVILALRDDVWVNAPIPDHNPNFVKEAPFVLDAVDGRLVVRGEDLEEPAALWLPPLYHGQANEHGEPYNSYAFTHGDRVRISPVEGCSMTCKFCDLPYEFRYRTKRVAGLVDSVRVALSDSLQPASHVLISGGTPRDDDIGYVREVYEAVIDAFPGVPVDVMMVPIEDLMDPEWLAKIGVAELSVNLEIFDREIARHLMRRKFDQGLDHYLDYLERAASIFAPGRVRSMLMVGLEPLESTLAGVDAIASRGAVPVLSPFRPDESTPLRDRLPPDADLMMRAYHESRQIAAGYGVALGPGCIPCSHNTLTLARTASGDASHYFGHPTLV